VSRFPVPRFVEAKPPISCSFDTGCAASGGGRSVGSKLGVAKVQLVVLAGADEESQPDRAARVSGVNEIALLRVLKHGLDTDVSAFYVGRAAEASAI
jgi:hypothetical protein